MTLAAVNRPVQHGGIALERKARPRSTAIARDSKSHRAIVAPNQRRNPYLRATINPAMIPVAANMPKHPDCRFTDGSHARV